MNSFCISFETVKIHEIKVVLFYLLRLLQCRAWIISLWLGWRLDQHHIWPQPVKSSGGWIVTTNGYNVCFNMSITKTNVNTWLRPAMARMTRLTWRVRMVQMVLSFAVGLSGDERRWTRNVPLTPFLQRLIFIIISQP